MKHSVGLGILAVAALAGCQVAPPEPEIAPPTLQLLGSEPLMLADDCAASSSVFVAFTVRRDGRPDNFQLPSVPACVRDALTAWISSFRYAPLPVEMPTGVEWMLVSARRGS
jgi:hypothetical protein